MTNSMSRNRKCAIVVPVVDQTTRGAVRRAWESGAEFLAFSSTGGERSITRTKARSEGIAEITIHFANRTQRMNVRVS